MLINATKSDRWWKKPRKFWQKIIAITAVGRSALVLMTSSETAFGQTSATSQDSKQESPLACNALAFSPKQRNRHFNELGPTLRSLRKSVRELDDGYEFEFPGDLATLQLLTEWTIQERQCCPFFEINLRLEPEGGSVWLRLTGRKGIKEFLQIDLSEWIALRE